jgi:hypothetical protein
MASEPQCPFCLQKFDTVDQLTQHLIFDNCQVGTPATELTEEKPPLQPRHSICEHQGEIEQIE